MKVEGKVAIISGGASGLGKGFGEALLQRGAKGICIVDVDTSLGRATEQEFLARYGPSKACFLQCDVTCPHQFKHVFRKARDLYGRIDIVVNDAGVANESTPERRSLMIDVNLKAVVDGTYLAREYMDERHGGVVVTVSSMAGLVGAPYQPVYTAVKQGVIGFSRILAQYDQLFNNGTIRLNVLCPSFVGDAGMFWKSKATGARNIADADDVDYQERRSSVKTIQLSQVVEGFMMLVEDDKINGNVMRVTREKGIDFQKFGSRYISRL